MAKILERMKSVLKRNRGPQNLPPGSYPNSVRNAETLGTITKPSYQTDDEDDEEEDIESLKNYNVPEQTRLRGPPINMNQSDDIISNRNAYGTPVTPRSDSSNIPGTSFRGASSGFVPDLPMNNNFNNNNNNINPPSNANTGTVPDLPSRPGFPPFLSQPSDPSSRPVLNPTPTSANNPQPSFAGFPPGMNSNQPPPPPPNNPQQRFAGFPPGMNSNQPPPPPPNNPQQPFAGFPPGMNSNQPPPPNNPQQPFAGFPPGMNQNQSSPPNNPQQSFSGFPPGMNFNQTQPPSNNNSRAPLNQTSPQSSVPGFPPGMNPQPSSNVQTNDPMNSQQGTLSKPSSSFRNQLNNHDDNVSRLELDYPIENVLVDANIPSAMAIKINDVVEQDRLGNAYHIHRYTFEPSEPQHISFDNNQRHTGNSFHGGTRHIREIHKDHRDPLSNDLPYSSRSNKHSRRRQHHHYSDTVLDQYIDQLLHTPGSTIIEAQNYNDLQQILNQQILPSQIFPAQPSINPFQSNTNALTGPVFYYTARALHDDPMRNY